MKETMENLKLLVENEEVVYQFCDELIEVSGDADENQMQNRRKLSSCIDNSGTLEICEPEEIEDTGFSEIANWSTEEDVLILIDEKDLIICVNKEDAIKYNLQPKTCCICGRKFYGWGNNPWPVKESGECCTSCNYDIVLPERLKKMLC